MKINFECTVNKYDEPDMLEQVQSILLVTNMLSPTKLKSEYVDNCDGTITIRVKDYELTSEALEDMNNRTSSLMNDMFENFMQ